MEYTFLISTKSGAICSFQPAATAVWGAKEVPPLFIQKVLDVEEKIAQLIAKECRYHNGFVYKDSGLPFEEEYAVVRTSTFDVSKNRLLARLVNGGISVHNAIEFLTPSFRKNLKENRKVWFQAVYAFRDRDKVPALLEAIKYGCFGDIFERVVALSPAVRKEILASVSTQDKDWVLRLARQ